MRHHRGRGWDRFKDLATESDAGADETILTMFLRLPLGFETCPCPCPFPFVFKHKKGRPKPPRLRAAAAALVPYSVVWLPASASTLASCSSASSPMIV